MNNPSLPRAEYPRPQFVRPDWLSLNGEWEFAFDDADEGKTEGWSDGRTLPQAIQVPFAYQASLSGIGDKAIHERVWYARSFELPGEWRAGPHPRDVLLHFGAVDFSATVWINGAEVGHNQGGHVPFSFDIAPYLAPGVNRITLRVEDPQDPHIPRGKQATSGLPRGCDYYCTTGIWQSVWLEPVSPIRIDDIRLRPVAGDDPEQDALEVQVHLHAPSTGWQIEVAVLEGETVTAHAADAAAGAAARFLIPLPRARRWSPDDPFLYGVRVRLRENGDLLDEIESYAGIRSVRCTGGRVILNGEPVFLAMVLDQGYWPDGGMTAPTDEALRADVEWCRRFGFNGARKHQKVEDPRWLYWCDRMGLLVWGEMPNARGWSN
ncbi:MAG: glycoside hydrolase family 2, partial [Chloroflexi bacterium]|nr:glycoside hydrolase family 2 [Chloroflexota bacterium]